MVIAQSIRLFMTRDLFSVVVCYVITASTRKVHKNTAGVKIKVVLLAVVSGHDRSFETAEEPRLKGE